MRAKCPWHRGNSGGGLDVVEFAVFAVCIMGASDIAKHYLSVDFSVVAGQAPHACPESEVGRRALALRAILGHGLCCRIGGGRYNEQWLDVLEKSAPCAWGEKVILDISFHRPLLPATHFASCFCPAARLPPSTRITSVQTESPGLVKRWT